MKRAQQTLPQTLTGNHHEHEPILQKIRELYQDLFSHDGFGELRITMRFLRKGQKEIIVICGKEYRFVVDYPNSGLMIS